MSRRTDGEVGKKHEAAELQGTDEDGTKGGREGKKKEAEEKTRLVSEVKDERET